MDYQTRGQALRSSSFERGNSIRKFVALLLYGVIMLASVWALSGGQDGLPTSREAARGMPRLFSLHEFWSSSAEKWHFQISPDGKQLAWLGDYLDESAILYRQINGSNARGIVLDHPIATRNDWNLGLMRRPFLAEGSPMHRGLHRSAPAWSIC